MVPNVSKFITALHKYYTRYYGALLPRILHHMCMNFEWSLTITIFEDCNEILQNDFDLLPEKKTSLMPLLWNWRQEVVSFTEPKYCEYRDAIFIFLHYM